MSERKLLGAGLAFDERIVLAQLTLQPGWIILVRLMAEACREATEAVVKLDLTAERYQERLAGLQTTARAMNKFSAEVLDSVKVHKDQAVRAAQEKENPDAVVEKSTTRFKGFKPPQPKTPSEGQK